MIKLVTTEAVWRNQTLVWQHRPTDPLHASSHRRSRNRGPAQLHRLPDQELPGRQVRLARGA